MNELTPDFQKNSDQLRQNQLRAGTVLLAKSELVDPNFDTTVVLICVYNKNGAYGLVLNRPSHMPVSEIFDGYSGFNKVKEICIGGPVQQDELQILQVTTSPMEGAYEVVPEVYVGGKWESINQIIEVDGASTRLFLGYSGWGPEQLDFEIKSGAWEIYNVDVKRLLKDPIEKIINNAKEIADYLESIKR